MVFIGLLLYLFCIIAGGVFAHQTGEAICDKQWPLACVRAFYTLAMLGLALIAFVHAP